MRSDWSATTKSASSAIAPLNSIRPAPLDRVADADGAAAEPDGETDELPPDDELVEAAAA